MNYENFSDREKQILQKVTEILETELHPKKIILFGSRAKGKFRKHSDFDFAIDTVEPDNISRRKLSEKIESISGLYKIDIVFLENVDRDFKKIIINSGKVLYAE